MLSLQISRETTGEAMELLLKYYKGKYFDKEGILAKPNDFSNFIAYHLQKVRLIEGGEKMFLDFEKKKKKKKLL